MKNTLFSCLFGSALYGTKTPTSDRDVKHLVLPDLNDLLVGKKVTNVVKKTNNQQNVRNSVDDVDEEFIPLQVFARDFMMGQTYALELAFAIDGQHAEQTFYDPRGTVVHDYRSGYSVKIRDRNFEEWDYETPYILEFIVELREMFLTSNIKAMMGYVVNQASLYSFKGERLNVSREFKELLEYALSLVQTDAQNYTLGDLFSGAEDLYGLNSRAKTLEEKYPKYFKKTEYDIGGGRMKPCFTLLEKTFPFTNKLSHSVTVCDSLINKYGSRADAASASNVDWKATMHALRIVDEGLMLLENRHLSFPFHPDYAANLLLIKRGEMDLSLVTQELTEKLDRLKTLEKTTALPAYSSEMQEKFDVWLANWMRKFYGI